MREVFINIHIGVIAIAFFSSIYNRGKPGYANIIPVFLAATIAGVVISEWFLLFRYRSQIAVLLLCMELLTWSFFFYHSIKNRYINYLQVGLSFLLVLFLLLARIVYDCLYETSFVVYKLSDALLAVLGLIVLLSRINQSTEKNLSVDPVFLISVAVTWYYIIRFCLGMFLFPFSSGWRGITVYDKFMLYYVPTFLFYLLIAIAMFMFNLRKR